MVSEFDTEDNASMDFSKNKNFMYYDPYNPDQSNQYAYLKYEDQLMLRSSLILDQYKDDFMKLE